MRITLDAECPDLGDEVIAAVHAYNGDMTLNVPMVRSGEMLAAGDARGCLVEEQFAAAHSLKPGNTLKLDLYGKRFEFTVRGTVLSPEYLITSKGMAPDPDTYGYVLISDRALPGVPYNDVLVAAKSGADLNVMERALSAAVPEAMVISQNTHPSTLQARNYVRLFRNMSYIFPVLAYFVAALVVVTTISRMMDGQRIQMGTLKALGYTDRQILLHYLFLHYIQLYFYPKP